MQKVVVRRLTKKNWESLKNNFIAVTQENFSAYSQTIKDYMTKEKYLKGVRRHSIQLGVFVDGLLVGYLLADRHQGGVMFVTWIGILKKYQRQGIGSKLLAEIEKISLKKGAHSIQLQASESNLPYYKKNGFEIIGLDRKGYFGTDNYLLKKVIQEPREENFLSYY